MNKDIPIIDTIGLDEDGVINAKKLFASKNIKLLPPHITTALILFDHDPSEEIIDESTELYKFIGASTITPQYIYQDKVVVAYSPLGGPASGGLIEELIAFGVKKFIACGSSGLVGEFDSQKFLIVTKAIRDEGLSYHYVAPSLYIETDTTQNKLVEEGLKKHHLEYGEGIAWTTDAFFRETKSKINKRVSQGAVAVEMECASMAAVCQFHQLPFSQVLYFSDIVKQESWSDFLDTRKSMKEKINKVMLDIACEL